MAYQRRWQGKTAQPQRWMRTGIRRVQRDGEERRQTVVDRLSGKTAKEDANYRSAHDAVEKATCFECVHFLNVGSMQSPCRRVAGVVEARDVCDLFDPRDTEPRGQGFHGYSPHQNQENE